MKSIADTLTNIKSEALNMFMYSPIKFIASTF
jgi:hypothetical protein